MPTIASTTSLEDFEFAAVKGLADQRKWSVSQTIAELVRESPTFNEELAKRQSEPAGSGK